MLQQIYTNRAEQFKLKAATLEQKYNRWSTIRLISFIAGTGLAIYLFSVHWAVFLGFVVLFLIGFARFVAWHQGVQYQQRLAQSLHYINANELAYLNGEYHTFDHGEDFENPLHPYSVDLDIFGNYSFFQYFNRTVTAIGRAKFAEYLQTLQSEEEIQARQESGKELSELLDWRQYFQAYGEATEESVHDIDLLLRWLKEDNLILGNRRLTACMRWLPIVLLVAIILSFFVIPYQIAVAIAVLQGVIILRKAEKINEIQHKTTKADDILHHYATLIAHIEGQDFKTQKLQTLQQLFIHQDTPASKSLRQLSKIISQLNVRYNAFAILLQATMMWDFQWIYRLEKWKARLKTQLPLWFEGLEEFDAMVSVGTVYYNHQDWNMPVIDNTGTTIEGKAVGHPLLAKEKRVDNDIYFPSNGHIKLITGSNMAGKSTFLRSIGINIVLAQIGLPVCAERFKIPSLQVFTSMRTQDALHESTSSFYAELKRLKVIIDVVEKQDNVFFLLDEILKGTNSNDRHTGSKALISQLIQSKGTGLIATHDLELGQLERTANGTIENLCMEVEVAKDKLIFDYKIKKGVSKSFNATYLMRNMGIRI